MDVLTWEGIHVIILTPGEYRECYQQESKYFQKCGVFSVAGEWHATKVLKAGMLLLCNCNSTNPLFEADLLCVNLGLYWLSYHFFHWCFLMFWTPVHFWLWRSPAVPFISMAFLYPKCQSHRTWTKNVHLSRTSVRKSHLASQPAAYRK